MRRRGRSRTTGPVLPCGDDAYAENKPPPRTFRIPAETSNNRVAVLVATKARRGSGLTEYRHRNAEKTDRRSVYNAAFDCASTQQSTYPEPKTNNVHKAVSSPYRETDSVQPLLNLRCMAIAEAILRNIATRFGRIRRPSLHRSAWCGPLSVLLSLTLCATAEGDGREDSARLYRTREEQREAGLHRELTPWLGYSGLLELEWTRDRMSVDQAENHIREVESSATAQLALTVTPMEQLKSEMIVEFDPEVGELEVDEITGALEIGSWELTMGRQYLPFGEYFSRFVSDPLLEFGETRDTAATLSYGYDDRIEMSVSVYQGMARKRNGSSRELDWTLALETWPREDLALGLSYQADLADAGSGLLAEDGNRFVRRVPGLSGYILFVGERFELTLETLRAVRSFVELEPDRDRPAAWNLELALFPHPRFDLAFRVEGSRELEDAPRLQWGAAVTVVLFPYTTLTLELLRGRFRDALATDDDDNAVDRRNRIAAQLSLGF